MNHIIHSDIARGIKPAELVLKNAQIVNVFNQSIEIADIAIQDGIIVGIGDYSGTQEIDCSNQYVAPGFIDGHVHIESSMLTPSEFSKLVVPKGTTRVIADPHEIANVKGVKGLGFMLRSSLDTPLHVHIMIPSCVPATAFETAGASIDAEDIYNLHKREGILGLGEVMDYPGVIHGNKALLDKLSIMQDSIIDGHAPGVTNKDLNAYLLHHIKTDHECTTKAELDEKVSRGMYVHLREGSATRNVKALVPGITEKTSHRLLFCTDDKHPMDIVNEGHINYNVNLATSLGVDPLVAIQMATINIATCYQLSNVGAIAPGYVADLIVFDDVKNIQPTKVFIDGELVADHGTMLFETHKYDSIHVRDTVKFNMQDINLDLPLSSNRVKVMQLVENNVTTSQVIRDVTVKNGLYFNNPDDDILKIAVVERHHYTKNVGVGLLEGYGLKDGAIAMTIAHDSHNLIVVGDNDKDMLVAIKELRDHQGGITIVHDGHVIDTLPLEIAGIMTNEDYEVVQEKLHHLEQAALKLGVNTNVDDPFLTLAFMALPVIPDLKLTDKGLFDVVAFQPTTIEVNDDDVC
ncbi:adenine deaminase [Candidatus Xianfuyuplasma coldseepsis]|uniref:Adenine deaminase n=1 Tax=Candidatus Xianfuyuplasma coldseepsis TaxID=2782163 RepID=A0A7L7KNR5_9MOLU|nr:adenine deaminase [Xianfuyuplasma coldseepsis]QMS84400.1 adenine deaminase [Xianfuyuplasma coldseepsis]